MGLLLVGQIAAPVAADPATPPDIEVHARVEARSVKIEQAGSARLELHVDPGVAEPVSVRRSAPKGQSSYRNLTIDLHAAARLTAPAAPVAETAVTTSPDTTSPGKPRQ
ncbi:MAG: hypothetical protein ACTHK5_08730 [Tsuneonella sp.]